MAEKNQYKIKNCIKLLPMYFILTIVSLLSIFPFAWMLIGATNKSVDITKGKITPGTALFDNINKLLANVNVPLVLFNSLKVAVLGTFLTLLVGALAGYGYEIYKNKFRERIYKAILLTMMIPFAALMIPLFRMFAIANLINTHFAVILPFIPWVFILFYFRQATKSFEKELISVARLDGLGDFRIFFLIYFPTMKSSFAAAAIITFMFHWNNYLWPLIVLQSNQQKTLTLVISALGSAYYPDYGVILLTVILGIMPMVLLFFFLQKKFVEGMLGAIK